MKGIELPSIIGTSEPFNSIIILSIPVADNADIKCSTVATREAPSPIAEHILVSLTASGLILTS